MTKIYSLSTIVLEKLQGTCVKNNAFELYACIHLVIGHKISISGAIYEEVLLYSKLPKKKYFTITKIEEYNGNEVAEPMYYTYV